MPRVGFRARARQITLATSLNATRVRVSAKEQDLSPRAWKQAASRRQPAVRFGLVLMQPVYMLCEFHQREVPSIASQALRLGHRFQRNR